MGGEGLLRPPPDWEEDLVRATAVDDQLAARVRQYPLVKIKKRNWPVSPYCKCKVARANAGVAPVIKLSDGRSMPGFGLGTWLGADSSGRVPVEDDSVEQAVGWAIDAGYRHVDTAAIYDTEAQVGRAINKKIEEGVIKREDVFVTTKLWNDAHAPAAVLPALRRSLENLNLSYVDLYLIHWPTGVLANGTFDQTDYLETWRALQGARAQGLARSLGVSNFNEQQLGRLLALSPDRPAVLQVEVNVNLQQPALLAFCRAQNITVTAYTPFGSLFKPRADAPPPPPGADDKALVDISNKYKKSVPQILLRYLVELGVIPIPKSVHKSRIEENIDVFDFALTPQERNYLKSFDRGYRTIEPTFLVGSPYYPFEKKKTEI